MPKEPEKERAPIAICIIYYYAANGNHD